MLGLSGTAGAGAATRPVASSSPSEIAKAINLMASDLPSSVTWVSSPQAANNKAENAAGRVAASCVKKAGAVTDDAYGTSGVTGGPVLADVKSPQFSDKANAFTQLPAANSEVVIVSNGKDATADLAAVGTGKGLACLEAQYQVNVVQSGSGNSKVSGTFMSVPHHGGGNGGVHIRLIATGGLLPQKLYNDEYFYAAGRAEVVLSFLDLGSPFDASWASDAATKVMQRAVARAG